MDNDDKIKEILRQLAAIKHDSSIVFNTAYTLLNNMDDAAKLKMTIGNYSCDMILIDVEVIEAFNEFLQKVIEYFNAENNQQKG
jgi:hypothetical protein